MKNVEEKIHSQEEDDDKFTFIAIVYCNILLFYLLKFFTYKK